MAVVSDSMYNARTSVASYVSSNAYYGYVPPCRGENQLVDIAERRARSGESSAFNRCLYDTAMETDDDGCDYSTASCRLNNHCVIPEASVRNRLEANGKQQHYRLQQQQQQQQGVHHDADTLRRRNRKRCNGDLGPARELKKFREGGGNGRVYYGTGSTKDYGLATVYYQSASLHVNTANDINPEWSSSENERCCWAAGNPSSISNTDCKHLLSCNGSKSTESNAEFEKILFETHGCSLYHHQRIQLLDNDCIETEF